jgi:MoxR-like ATPase
MTQMPSPPPAVLLAAHIAALESGLLEREAAVRLVLLAALAGEHVLLIGPPGTAKSELARHLHSVFAGARYFERLLTRFSTPEELFGPLSLKALEDDRYERLTDGFLPTAGIAFLDEVFNANSAILNALLTVLNEREFDNGSGRVQVPLISVIGATNELPSDTALQAFHDRFLLRVPVAPVSDGAFEALLRLPARPPAAPAEPIVAEQRQAIAAAAARVVLGDEALAACQALRRHLAEQHIAVSDRRWRRWLGLMCTAAASEGRSRLDVLDLWLVPYVMAAQPDDVAPLAVWFEAELLGAVPQPARWLTHAVEAFEQQLEIERNAEAGTASDDASGKLALARAIGGSETSDPMLRLVSEQLEAAAHRRYSPVHLAARLAQIDEVVATASQGESQVAAAAAHLADALSGRLWLPPTLAQRLNGAHAQTLATLRTLLQRLSECRAGFAALPADDQLPAVAPPALDLAGTAA